MGFIVNKEDFNKTLIKVWNSPPLIGDKPLEKLLIRTEVVRVMEFNKMYKDEYNGLILKSDLLKPNNRHQMFIPHLETYCLPGDEEKAAEAIRAALQPRIQALLDQIQGIAASINGGLNIVDNDTYLFSFKSLKKS